MTEAEKIVTKVSRDLHKLTQLVTGNGSPEGSVMYRIKQLELMDQEILEKIDSAVSRPCIYKEAMEREDSVKQKRRTFRIGDIANIIQLALLCLVVYSIFIQ